MSLPPSLLRWPLVLVSWALLGVTGCVPLEQDAEAEGSGGSQAGGKGDEDPVEPSSCDAWKVSYCRAVDRCSFGSREQCELDVGYVMCREDVPVGECARAIDAATCGEMPSECAPARVADRTLPTEVCRALQAEICEWSLYCGYDFSLEGCQSNLAAVQPCNEFTAVLPGHEQCLSDYRTLPCTEHLPPSCEGLLRR